VIGYSEYGVRWEQRADFTRGPRPPMPARITYEQAKGFTTSFLRGQPRRAAIAPTLFRDKLGELRG
jgi:hypothetical protein